MASNAPEVSEYDGAENPSLDLLSAWKLINVALDVFM